MELPMYAWLIGVRGEIEMSGEVGLDTEGIIR